MLSRDGLDVSRKSAFLPRRRFKDLSLLMMCLKGVQKTVKSTAGQETWKDRHKKLKAVLYDRWYSFEGRDEKRLQCEGRERKFCVLDMKVAKKTGVESKEIVTNRASGLWWKS